MAACVAVIAKENYPLYLRSSSNKAEGSTEEDLKFFYTVHTSLDVIEERMFSSSSTSKSSTNDPRELYLGLLYPTEDYRVYGYMTNTKVKFVILVDASNTTLRDNEIRSMFRQLHNAYADLMCDPFYTPGESITHKPFERVVTSMLAPTSTNA